MFLCPKCLLDFKVSGVKVANLDLQAIGSTYYCDECHHAFCSSEPVNGDRLALALFFAVAEVDPAALKKVLIAFIGHQNRVAHGEVESLAQARANVEGSPRVEEQPRGTLRPEDLLGSVDLTDEIAKKLKE